MRWLLVEDDTYLGDAVRAGLMQAGYTVDWVRDGVAAEHALRSEVFDGVVLDLGLPRRDGLEVLRDLRKAGCELPVLILTARDAVSDRVKGLDAGADDYLVKPFELDELTARLRAIFRRRTGRATAKIHYRDLVLDPGARDVTLGGRTVGLVASEYAVLEALLQRPGQILTRERLEEILYGWGEAAQSNTVEVHIHHLRRKLGKELIRTVRGVGYQVPVAS